MRASIRATCCAGRFRITINCTDSGSTVASTILSTSGHAPPSAKTLGQPTCGISHDADKPPIDNPAEKPQNIALTITPRARAGEYSAIKVTALGIAAPSPSPVSRRSTVSEATDDANTEARLQTPKQATDTDNTVLRPTRSAIGPASSAPIPSPINAALMTGPSAARLICH
jgi:hypothetical protein